METPEIIDATIIILTKNEERHIERAVLSASRFRTVLVVDSGSNDRTVEIAEAAGAKVIGFSWDGAYPKKKEWSLHHVQTDWVFYLDADEFFCDEHIPEIAQTLSNSEAAAFEVPLRYFWLGKELKHGHKVTKRIGMNRLKARWPQPDDLAVKNMWEVEGHYQPQVIDGSVVRGQAPLGHNDEDGLYEYFSRHNRYSDWEARMLHMREPVSEQSRSRLGRLAVKLPAKPAVFFAYSYVFRLGFLDGAAGFSYAIALSFYYWQISLKIRELKIQGDR
jgi:glycosyltransferase involved in cell wall biosynthesis